MANNEHQRAYIRRRRIKIRDLVLEQKAKPCEDCGQSFPYWVMHLHHRDPADKKFTAAELVRNPGISWARIVGELNKCATLCANCHALRHPPTPGEIVL